MTRPGKRTTARRKRSRSVAAAEYRARYADGSCGDDLAVRLKQRVAAADGSVDVAKLRQLAEANGVWVSSYADLNPGLQRMTIGNRLRPLARRGKVKWGRR